MNARIMRQDPTPGKAHRAEGDGVRVARTVRVIVVAVVLAGCAGSTDPGPAATSRPLPAPVEVLLPRAALPGMDPVDRHLVASSIADEVTHPDLLVDLLSASGFEGGYERRFSGQGDSFTRVTARSLTFADEAGARAFLDWFADHAGNEIVTARRIEPAAMPAGAVVFEHEPDPCCHNDVPAYLAAWPRGSTVLYLHVGGRDATAGATATLIARYDREA
jgi:hypothetical protein